MDLWALTSGDQQVESDSVQNCWTEGNTIFSQYCTTELEDLELCLAIDCL